MRKVHAEGTPAQAFQSIADQCHDHGIKTLSRLFIRVEGMGKDAAKDVRSLGLAIPQMGKAQFLLEQRLVLEFGGDEKFAVEFKGSWDRYKRIKQVTDTLSQEASNASVRMARHGPISRAAWRRRATSSRRSATCWSAWAWARSSWTASPERPREARHE